MSVRRAKGASHKSVKVIRKGYAYTDGEREREILQCFGAKIAIPSF